MFKITKQDTPVLASQPEEIQVAATSFVADYTSKKSVADRVGRCGFLVLIEESPKLKFGERPVSISG